MNWGKRKIGELCKIGRGSSPRPINDQRYFIDGNIPWVKIADATSSYRKIYRTKQYVNDFGASFSRKLPEGSLIIGTSGTLGLPMFLGVEGCIHDGWLYVGEFNGIDKYYLYYKLMQLKDYFYSKAYGVAIQNISTDILRETEINLPSLNIQEKISSILNSYDDLIENNLRRIELLEEAAQLLFREWFVHLQFPGHEHTKIANGTPEGWGIKRLSELAYLTMGQSPKSQYYNEEGEGLAFHQGVTDFGARFVTHNKYCTVQNRIAGVGDILCSVRAPVGRLNITLDKIIIGRGLSALRSKSNNQSFLYYQLKNHFFQEDIIGGGTIFASTTRQQLEGQEFLQPENKMIELFEEYSKPIDEQVKNLFLQIQQSRKARDILLPRLMNGDIAV